MWLWLSRRCVRRPAIPDVEGDGEGAVLFSLELQSNIAGPVIRSDRRALRGIAIALRGIAARLRRHSLTLSDLTDFDGAIQLHAKDALTAAGITDAQEDVLRRGNHEALRDRLTV